MNTNLAVLSGIITNDPVARELPDGTTVFQFDVATVVDRNGRPANVSVPVAWHDPSAAAVAALIPAEHAVVIGRVERRFFRSGGSTQSRTEVVAEHVVPSRRAKTARSVIAAAAATLAEIPV